MSGDQPGLFDEPDEIERNPVKPYAGEHGHAGTETSRQRALSGRLGKTQSRVLRAVGSAGRNGATVAELRRVFDGDLHHGSISGALTELHRGHVLSRLAETRDRCHIYVLPGLAEGREVQRVKPTAAALAHRLHSCEIVDATAEMPRAVDYDGSRYYSAADLLDALLDGWR